MSWPRRGRAMLRSRTRGLTAYEKRQVKTTINRMEPKDWRMLYVSPYVVPGGTGTKTACEPDVFDGSSCSGKLDIRLADLSLAPVAGPMGTYQKLHQSQGGLWFYPRIASSGDMQQLDMRFALYKLKADVGGSSDPPELFDYQDIIDFTGIIHRQQWWYWPTITVDLPKHWPSYVQWMPGTEPVLCDDHSADRQGVMTPCPVTASDVHIAAGRPVFWSARHIPRNLVVKEDEILFLRVEWANDSSLNGGSASSVPDLIVRGYVRSLISGNP